jgi:hypothetical protein
MKIAVGNSRMDKKWKNQDISWADLCARCGSIRTTETVEEYRKLKKGQQDGIKDVGGFVGGHLREGRRKNGMVLCRSLLTLDMDYGTPDIWDEITLFHDFKCCVYSTHKHTPPPSAYPAETGDQRRRISGSRPHGGKGDRN